MSDAVLVYQGNELASYGFGDPHPFGFDRHDAFQGELAAAGLGDAISFGRPHRASVDELMLFHTAEYINMVSMKCAAGPGISGRGRHTGIARHIRGRVGGGGHDPRGRRCGHAR